MARFFDRYSARSSIEVCPTRVRTTKSGHPLPLPVAAAKPGRRRTDRRSDEDLAYRRRCRRFVDHAKTKRPSSKRPTPRVTIRRECRTRANWRGFRRRSASSRTLRRARRRARRCVRASGSRPIYWQVLALVIAGRLYSRSPDFTDAQATGGRSASISTTVMRAIEATDWQ
jgi:hypothetical protein